MHDAKHPPSFNSVRWKTGYNPDIAFVNQTIGSLYKKGVVDPIPRTQHCPISVSVHAAVTPTIVPYQRRFNFQKADWISFTTDLENQIYNIIPTSKNYELLTNPVQNIARKYFPRGCRTRYVPCLNEESLNMLDKFKTLYKEDPFAEDTITAEEQLMASMTQERQQKWLDASESTDMFSNSKKAWNLIRKLNNDTAILNHQHYPVTANQVAHQLLVNGQTKGKKTPRVKFRKNEKQNMGPNLTSPFTAQEFSNGIAPLKNGMAIGLNGIFTEELKYFGQQAKKWLLELFNRCVETNRIPWIWWKSRVIAFPKPGKDLSLPKSFRQISLLRHQYKLFERLLLGRLTPVVELKIIPQQTGFRESISTTGQLLNLTQHIEDGFEKKLVTGAVFVDLFATYDTVESSNLDD